MQTLCKLSQMFYQNHSLEDSTQWREALKPDPFCNLNSLRENFITLVTPKMHPPLCLLLRSVTCKCSLYTHGKLQHVLQFGSFFLNISSHLSHFNSSSVLFFNRVVMQVKIAMKAKIKCFPRVSSMCIFKIPAEVSALQHNSQIKP